MNCRDVFDFVWKWKEQFYMNTLEKNKELIHWIPNKRSSQLKSISIFYEKMLIKMYMMSH